MEKVKKMKIDFKCVTSYSRHFPSHSVPLVGDSVVECPVDVE